MADISNIVSVNLDIRDFVTKQLGFGVPNVVGTHKKFNERARRYGSIDGVADDGFSTDSVIYNTVNRIFEQNPSIEYLWIGRRSADGVIVNVDDVEDNATYTTTINDTDITANSGTSATAESIATALVTAINASDEPVTATDNSDGTYTVAADTANEAYTIETGDKQSINELEASDTLTNDLQAIEDFEKNWYNLLLAENGTASELDDLAEEAAEWVESRMKLFGYDSSNANNLDAQATDSISVILSDKGYDRTYMSYHPDPDDHFSAAWAGARLTQEPGSTNWANTELVGVDAVKLTESETNTLHGNNMNTFRPYGLDNNDGVTRPGVVASGRFIDIRRGADWIISTLQTRIFDLIRRLGKINYTDAGIGKVVGVITNVLKDAEARNLLSDQPNEGFDVDAPLYANISTADKVERRVQIPFIAFLAGAIDSVEISGTLTV